jgi:hypothetical protein
VSPAAAIDSDWRMTPSANLASFPGLAAVHGPEELRMIGCRPAVERVHEEDPCQAAKVIEVPGVDGVISRCGQGVAADHEWHPRVHELPAWPRDSRICGRIRGRPRPQAETHPTWRMPPGFRRAGAKVPLPWRWRARKVKGHPAKPPLTLQWQHGSIGHLGQRRLNLTSGVAAACERGWTPR